MTFLLNLEDERGYWLTRLLLERGIGIICLIAFIVAFNQFNPLLGERGLLPVPLFVKQIPFKEAPSLFYLFPRNWVFSTAAILGIVLSILVITGISARFTWSSVLVWFSIYVLYLSFVNVGQIFYAFGWESILLEACFFAIFLGGAKLIPQAIPIWLFRWLLFRIVFGAGLIKLRGDPCWRDLTCLNYHYETQPMPGPLSWFLHWGPSWLGRGGVLFNHFAELIVPFAFFLPQPIAGIAGIISIVFQFSIIISGNLSWLNWLTLILAFSTLDAKFFSGWHLFPAHGFQPPSLPIHWSHLLLLAFVVFMSIPVVANMLSSRQVMNTNFNSFHLVGTYGAFGSITRTRYEVTVEGTADTIPASTTVWREYMFKGKPGDLSYWPPQIAPYHLRLDWLMWFAAMGDPRQYPWFAPFLQKLLEGDAGVLGLLRTNPFPDTPPALVRARLFEYQFTTPTERRQTGNCWKRTLAGEYFPPVSLQTLRGGPMR